jgi:hypothetical protein
VAENFICDDRRLLKLFLAEHAFAVGDIEDGQIETCTGRAVLCDGHLARDAFDGGGSVIFHHAHAGLGFEDHDEHAVVVNVDDEKAEFFTLLVNAVEIGFIHQTGDGLVGHERAGRERGDGGQIEVTRIALMRDEKAALVDDQRRRCIRRSDELAERFVEPPDVVFDELWESGHVMRIAGRFG